MIRITTAFLTLLLAWSVVAQATQVVRRSARELGAESPLVVQGRVESTRSFWNDSRTKILTEAVVGVDETHKGATAAAVRVVQLGGVVGHVRMAVAGALSWDVGEEVILFLEPMRDGAHRVAGFSQGKYRVQRDPATGTAFVEAPSLDGVEWVGSARDDAASRTSRVEKMAVDHFINQALGRR